MRPTKIIFFGALTVLTVTALFVTSVYADSLIVRNSDTREIINLRNLDDDKIVGEVEIESSLRSDGLHRVRIKIDIKDDSLLSMIDDHAFEGWLIDDESGYKLSLGALDINSFGRGSLKMKQDMVNFSTYDEICITKEPLGDDNPHPGPSIIEARILKGHDSNDDNGMDDTTDITFVSVINGANSVPPINSSAVGTGKFEISTATNTIRFEIDYMGLSSAETAAHIHGPAGPGENAGVLMTLPLGAEKDGIWNYPESLEADILAGRTYVNVHTINFPDGEIRGQIAP